MSIIECYWVLPVVLFGLPTALICKLGKKYTIMDVVSFMNHECIFLKLTFFFQYLCYRYWLRWHTKLFRYLEKVGKVSAVLCLRLEILLRPLCPFLISVLPRIYIFFNGWLKVPLAYNILYEVLIFGLFG